MYTVLYQELDILPFDLDLDLDLSDPDREPDLKKYIFHITHYLQSTIFESINQLINLYT